MRQISINVPDDQAAGVLALASAIVTQLQGPGGQPNPGLPGLPGGGGQPAQPPQQPGQPQPAQPQANGDWTVVDRAWDTGADRLSTQQIGGVPANGKLAIRLRIGPASTVGASTIGTSEFAGNPAPRRVWLSKTLGGAPIANNGQQAFSEGLGSAGFTVLVENQMHQNVVVVEANTEHFVHIEWTDQNQHGDVQFYVAQPSR